MVRDRELLSDVLHVRELDLSSKKEELDKINDKNKSHQEKVKN